MFQLKTWFYWLGILFYLSLSATAWGKMDQATRYLECSTSLRGPTGWINIPSASLPGSGKLSAGIHLNYAKVNLGVWDIFEGGIYFEADQLGDRFKPYRNLSRWELVEKNIPAFMRDSFRGNAKLKLLDQDWAMISLAGGIEEQDYYIVAQRFMSELSRVTLLAGWGTGRFEKSFFGFSKTIFSGAEIIFEYDGQGINFGLRLLLAPNLILDLAGRNLDTVGEVQDLGEVISGHLLFGITYVERVW
ncbi:hypothetical protein JW933_00040 [candidate division FCPU426 bacterium]|nr:hypothetical protein [candidate division FCPU426 bacterium]